jgi:hypothetical protein
MANIQKSAERRKPISFTSLRQANVEALARALGSLSIINEQALAEKLEMPVEDVRVAFDDLVIAGRYRIEVQDVARLARRMDAREEAAA